MVRNMFLAVPIAVIALGGSTACATKKFVRTSVGEVISPFWRTICSDPSTLFKYTFMDHVPPCSLSSSVWPR